MDRIIYNIYFALLQFSVVIFGNLIPPSHDILLKDNDTTKSIQRYGFHKTHDCEDFHKAYMCVKECLERGYHVAESDRSCTCRCYKNRDKAAYLGLGNATYNRFKYPIPTTRMPLWFVGKHQKLSAGEIVDTSIEFPNDPSFEPGNTGNTDNIDNDDQDDNNTQNIVNETITSTPTGDAKFEGNSLNTTGEEGQNDTEGNGTQLNMEDQGNLNENNTLNVSETINGENITTAAPDDEKQNDD